MDFGFTPEQDAMRESVRRFMRERVAPRVAECEKQREFAWDLLPQLQPFGYLGGLLPEEAGAFGMAASMAIKSTPPATTEPTLWGADTDAAK